MANKMQLFWFIYPNQLYNTQNHPAATSVEITRSCSYSDMLLMMGENIAWNM